MRKVLFSEQDGAENGLEKINTLNRWIASHGNCVATILCIIPVIIAYYQTVLLLTDYGIAWQLVEVGSWKPQIAAWGFPSSFSDIRHGLNWPIFEYIPRITRPLSDIFELFDTPFRAMLWREGMVLPSLSLTWPLTLVVAPLLLFSIVRRFNVQAWIALLIVALYLSNPGILSLEVMLFRPAKAIANVCILLILWLGAGQDRKRKEGRGFVTLHFAGLSLILLISLFFDEVVSVIYPALVLLFPRLVFYNKRTLALFLSIPVLYASAIRWAMPALIILAGYPDPSQGYISAQVMTKLLSLRLPYHDYVVTLGNIIGNTQSIVMDSFGLIDPWLPNTYYYTFLFYMIVYMIAAFVGFVLVAAWKTQRLFSMAQQIRKIERSVRTESGLMWRIFCVVVAAFIYEGILMSVSLGDVRPRVWGLYYYGAFCVIFLLIFLALIWEKTRMPLMAGVAFTMTVMCATFFIFPATNQAYKDVHYYPYSPGRLEGIFANKENRFIFLRSDSEFLYTKTVALRDSAVFKSTMRGIPRELSFVIYELGLTPDQTSCGTHYIDLVWEDSRAKILCNSNI